MREEEVIRFYKKEKKLKSLKEAEEKIELFWSALMEALNKEGRVVFKDWGIFEVKEIKPRRVKIPNKKETIYTSAKKVMTFKCGNALRENLNKGEN